MLSSSDTLTGTEARALHAFHVQCAFVLRLSRTALDACDQRLFISVPLKLRKSKIRDDITHYKDESDL